VQTRCFFEKKQGIQGVTDAFLDSIGKHLAWLLFTKWMKIVARCMWAMAIDDVVFRGGLGPLVYAPEIAVPWRHHCKYINQGRFEQQAVTA